MASFLKKASAAAQQAATKVQEKLQSKPESKPQANEPEQELQPAGSSSDPQPQAGTENSTGETITATPAAEASPSANSQTSETKDTAGGTSEAAPAASGAESADKGESGDTAVKETPAGTTPKTLAQEETVAKEDTTAAPPAATKDEASAPQGADAAKVAQPTSTSSEVKESGSVSPDKTESSTAANGKSAPSSSQPPPLVPKTGPGSSAPQPPPQRAVLPPLKKTNDEDSKRTPSPEQKQAPTPADPAPAPTQTKTDNVQEPESSSAPPPRSEPAPPAQKASDSNGSEGRSEPEKSEKKGGWLNKAKSQASKATASVTAQLQSAKSEGKQRVQNTRDRAASLKARAGVKAQEMKDKVADSKVGQMASNVADSMAELKAQAKAAAVAKLEQAQQAYLAAKTAAKEKARAFHERSYAQYQSMKETTTSVFKTNVNKLEEDDETQPLFKIAADEDLQNARELDEFKSKRQSVRKTKKIHTILLLPVALAMGFLAVAYYSYSLIVKSHSKMRNYVQHGVSLSLYIVLYILLFVGVFAVAPWAVENDKFEATVGTALGSFFAILLAGALFALWRVRNNALYHAIDYRSSRMRWTFDNTLGVIGLVTEFLSLTAFAFPRTIAWDETALGRATQDALRVFVFDFGIGNFKVSFWIMFGCMIIFFTMVPAIMILELYVKYPVERIAASSLVVNLFPVFSDTLFYALINTMFATIDCTFLPNGTQMTLDADPSILCWEGNHRLFALFSMTALMVYYPTALFYGSYLKVESNGAFGGETLDFKFKPIYYMFEITIKVILGGVMTFFSSFDAPSLSLMIVVTLLFASINTYFKPCCLTWVNKWKNAVFLNTTWAAICALIATGSPTAAIILLYVGWAALVITSIVLFIQHRKARQKEEAGSHIYTLGRGRHGELGHGGRLNLKKPMRVAFFDLDPHIKSIASCGWSSFAVTAEHVYSWGGYGLLGHPNIDALRQDLIEPLSIKALHKQGVERVVAGEFLAAAITNDGRLYTWASDPVAVAQEFDGSDYEPMLIDALGSAQVTDVFLGYQPYIFALTSDEKVYSWGYNQSGILGAGVESRVVPSPTEVTALAGLGVVDIQMKDEYAMARTKDGKLYAWGNGSFYVLGLGSPEDALQPTLVESLADAMITQISCAQQYVLALTATGEVYSWGRYDKINYLELKEQLGEQEANILDPSIVISFSDRKVIKVSAECEEYPLALTDDGTVYRLVWKTVQLDDIDNVARKTREALHMKGADLPPTLIIRRLLSSRGPDYHFNDIVASRHLVVGVVRGTATSDIPVHTFYHRDPVIPFDSLEIDDKKYFKPMKRVDVPRPSPEHGDPVIVPGAHHIMALLPIESQSSQSSAQAKAQLIEGEETLK